MKKAIEYNLIDPEVMEDPYEFYTTIHNENVRAVYVDGYKYTIVSGKVTYNDRVSTGELPGKLIRS